MPTDTSRRWADAAVFLLLIAIGAAGRWGQPDWCVTPIAAVGLFAGYHFGGARIALAVPVAAMLLTDAALPRYESPWVLVAVYAAMAAPALLGRLLRRPLQSRWAGVARLSACATAPALLFFFVTNTVYWAVGSLYAKTPAGLVECYAAAVPFLRRMAAGDVAYTGTLFAAAAVVGAYSLTGRTSDRPESSPARA